MCGICGFAGLDLEHSRKKEILLKMNNSIYHRGPDESGMFIDNDVALAMRRLSILDLEHGSQPIFNKNKTICTVFNGEIYNYQELKTELLNKGYEFHTHVDTEIIVYLYEEYGDDFAKKLRGMFAIAIWNSSTKELLLVRDHIGIKPLYYSYNDQILQFGSELKTILASKQLNLSINPQAVDAFLTFMFIPSPLTIYKQINKLDAGHYLKFSNGNIEIIRYWNLAVPSEKQDFSITETENIIHDSIKKHLQSDVPMGAFVSGGIDSSLVAAVASDNLSYPLSTFTIYFTGKNNFLDDERPYVHELSKKHTFDQNEMECDQDFKEIVEQILDAFDEPFGDDSLIPNFYISQLASKKVKVVLSGLGGDELFAGYRRHNGIRIAGWLRKVPVFFLKLFIKIINLIPEPKNGSERVDHIKRFFKSFSKDLSDTYFGFLSSIDNDDKAKLYKKEFIDSIDLNVTKSFVTDKFNIPESKNPVDRALYTDLMLYMPDQILVLSDRLSMQHSLEIRVPLADKDVIEHCVKIKPELKIKGTKAKYLLKEIASKILPDSIINHRKQGFEPPMASWLKHELKDMLLETLNEDNLEKHGFFQVSYVNKLIDDHLHERRKNNKILFCLLMFQLWYNRFEKEFS